MRIAVAYLIIWSCCRGEFPADWASQRRSQLWVGVRLADHRPVQLHLVDSLEIARLVKAPVDKAIGWGAFVAFSVMTLCIAVLAVIVTPTT
ncbi:hypothetical protein [Streptomyces fungicidicus]|uniref:hypothetical protein n=1 Tax=Streptomyces fungicidicus TaxID=68203 RepID=UPI0038184313